MRDYEQLARMLIDRKSTPSEAKETVDLPSLKKFLSSAAGRDAARASIDRIIANYKIYGDNKPPHQEIMKSIFHAMKRGANDPLLGLREQAVEEQETGYPMGTGSEEVGI